MRCLANRKEILVWVFQIMFYFNYALVINRCDYTEMACNDNGSNFVMSHEWFAMPIFSSKQHMVLNVTREFYHKLIDN